MIEATCEAIFLHKSPYENEVKVPTSRSDRSLALNTRALVLRLQDGVRQLHVLDTILAEPNCGPPIVTLV